MSLRRLIFVAIAMALIGSALPFALARDLRITLPKRSELTPVQRLNRQGVDAIRKHQFDKAEGLFYKAYLFDPTDPFTLNNLGYISELRGNLTRAQRFYSLASEQDSNAIISLSNAKQLEGKPMTDALTTIQNTPLRVNRMNVAAIGLLSQNRNFEADQLLRQALTLDPKNPFTLNNLGVADEATGDAVDALKYYDAAAASRSQEPIVVTLDRSWRGKPVSQMASDSARRLRKRMRTMDNGELQATMLTWRGVAAMNSNDWPAAKKDFLAAYRSNPNSAFTLNNLGYVSEKSGDLETAQFYYSKARRAEDASARIGLATQQSAEGQALAAVADDSGLKVGSEIRVSSRAAHTETGPVQLIRRGAGPPKPNPPSTKPTAPVPPNSTTQPPK